MENKEFYRTLKPVRINCPLCGHAKHEELCYNDRYQMGLTTVGCLNCGMIFINPRPSGQMMLKFYEHDYRRFYESVTVPSEEYINSGPFIPRARFVIDTLTDQINSESNGLWLDIGCAEGTLLNLGKEKFPGFQFYGVEPSLEFGKYALHNSGADDVYIGSFDSFFETNTSQYDVITLCHVLEHILDPIKLLSSIYEILKPDGLLYIEVPNVADPRAKGIGHIHLGHVLSFTPETLAIILKRTSFNIKLTQTENLPAKTPAMAMLASKGSSETGHLNRRGSLRSTFNAYRKNICGDTKIKRSPLKFWK